MKERLQYIITNEGLTNLRFAEMLGVNPASISHILAERNKPSFDFIVKIAEKLPHYDLRWLLTGEGSPIAQKKAEQPSAVTAVPSSVATTEAPGQTFVFDKQSQQPYNDEPNNINASSSEPVNLSSTSTASTKLIVCFPDGTFEEYTHR